MALKIQNFADQSNVRGSGEGGKTDKWLPMFGPSEDFFFHLL